MAERRPLVVVNGRMKEMPTGDTLPSSIVPDSETSGGSGFLPAPDDLDERSLIFVLGWEEVNGGWLIRSQRRDTSVTLDATVANYSSYTTYANAWAARISLTYE